jgi:hypothetical protein
MQLVRWLLAACVVVAVIAAVLNTLLKSAFRSECIKGKANDLRSSAIACIAIACLNLALHAALVVVRPLAKRSWHLLRTILSNWTLQYFVFVSLQQIALTAIVTNAVLTGKFDDICSFSDDVMADVAAQLRHCSVLAMALSVVCCDVDETFTPLMRRSAYCLLAIFSASDVIGSIVVGNALATGVKLSLNSFSFAIDTQITSCIMSQALMFFHFAVVSLRSIDGRAWAFDQLRFELQDTASAPQQQRAPARRATMLDHLAAEVLQDNDRADDEGVLFRMRLAFLTFQRRKFAKCRVFAIPCDEFRNVLRPFFKLSFFKHLHHMADSHPVIYFGFVTVVGFCSILSSFFSSAGILSGSSAGAISLVLNTFVFVAFIGYMSSLRNNIDSAAAKHILLCFRFNYCVALFTCWIGLYIREVYLSKTSFWQFAATFVMMLLFCFSLLTDCAPRLSSVLQFSISVISSASLTSSLLLSFAPRKGRWSDLFSGRLVHVVWILDHSQPTTD